MNTNDISGVKFGCQSYSWHMSGTKYVGNIEHMASVAAEAGFAGFEPEWAMLGPGFDGSRLANVLAERGLRLAAICYVAEWLHAEETLDEQTEVDDCLRLLSQVGEGKLVLVPLSLSGDHGLPLDARQRSAVACINAIARRARVAGIRTTVHPNSSPGSPFRSAEDYEVLFSALDGDVGFTPDVGHVAHSGMDPLATLRQYRARVDHLHFKDMHEDGTWAPTGSGCVDFPGILSYLHKTGFDGWVMFEDESSSAESDPDAAARRNGEYVRTTLLPLLAAPPG